MSGVVLPADLEAAFKQSKPVSLSAGVTSVSGVIPSGKTLYITEGNPKVKAGDFLEVKGTIEVQKLAVLDASYTASVGYIKGTGTNKITGEGAVSLPAVKGVGTLPADGIGYASTAVASTTVKVAGSVVEGSGTGTKVAASNLPDLFTDLGVDELALVDITGLASADIPPNKTLTLAGVNTTTGALTLASGATLIVDGTLTPGGAGVALTASTANSKIIINSNGTLALAAIGDTLVGTITNNGTITSVATAAATQKALLTEVTGSGTVQIGGAGAAVLDATETIALSQNVTIVSGTSAEIKAPVIAKPFSGGKTITITGTGVLNFGAAVAGLDLSGVIIKNEGTAAGAITTATLSDVALDTMLQQVGGRISSGALVDTSNVGITVPENANLTHATGVIVGGETPIAIYGTASFGDATFADQTGPVSIGAGASATFTDGTFAALVTGLSINPAATLVSFPAATFAALNQPLTLGGTVNFPAGTFLAMTGPLTVNGTSTFTVSTFPALTDLTIGPETTATFTAGTFNALESLSIGEDATVDLHAGIFPELTGSLILPASATFTSGLPAATFAKLDSLTINKSGLTLTAATFAGLTSLTAGADVTLGAVVAPTNNLTVNNGAGIITAGGITVAAETILTNNGKIVIPAAGTLKLATGVEATKVGKIAGGTTGTITLGPTVISGAWEAVGTSTPAFVTMTSANTGVTIAGVANAPGLKAGDSGGTITQKNTIGSSMLTIGANMTLNLGTTGTITLEAGTNAGGITFADATSLLLVGAGTNGTALAGFTNFAINGFTLPTPTTIGAANFKAAGGTGGVIVEIGGTGGSFKANTGSDNIAINSTSTMVGT
ncbi:MAG: hypothetical protein LBK83_02010 [Treponema sp.]|nr:hypothetical protein [Treponema sp.]